MWLMNQEGNEIFNLKTAHEIAIRNYTETFSLYVDFVVVGEYDTIERAKEVLEEILTNSSFGIKVYKMPQE